VNTTNYWNRYASRYDLSMLLLGKPMPRMLELTRESVRGLDRVLEVGAGTGLVTNALSDAARSVAATDFAPAMVAQLERRIRNHGLSNVECQRADIYALPFAPSGFDAVVAANVLHLVPDLPRAIAALRSQLRPLGRLLVPTFCHDETVVSRAASRLLALTGFPGHRRFRMPTLRRELENAGLLVTRAELIPGVIPIAYMEGQFRE
jgi:phosphatidylethanolamine/phosphatidyl-N-methylethanolamine N-methyltransferase